jgi:hypothetical protein
MKQLKDLNFYTTNENKKNLNLIFFKFNERF